MQEHKQGGVIQFPTQMVKSSTKERGITMKCSNTASCPASQSWPQLSQLFNGLKADQLFNSSEEPMSKLAFLATEEEVNESPPFTAMTQHRHVDDPSCRSRIDAIREKHIRRMEEAEGRQVDEQ